MVTKTANFSITTFLFLLCIVVSLFQNYELTFAVWTLVFLITIKQKYSFTILQYISIFGAILIISFIPTLFIYSNKLFAVIKDFTYIVKPILGLLVGYQLFRYSSKKGLTAFVTIGLYIAILHIGLLLYGFLKYKSLDLNLIRSVGGYFSDYEIFVLIILIFKEKFNLEFSQKKAMFFTIVIGFSSLMYFARTNMIQLIILVLAMKGYLFITEKSIKVILFLILGVFIGYTIIYNYNPKRNGKGIDAILYKIKIAPEEAFKTHINREDWKDFNDNYRSFENIIAIKQVSAKGIGAILFGEGLGSTLNLGQKIRTTDGSLIQYIPIAHNAFMTVFLKSGVFGVLFLILFMIVLYKQQKSNIESVNNINMLLLGTSIFLIVSNWVFMGLYLKLDNKSIIIGFLIALKEVLIRENKSQIAIENE